MALDKPGIGSLGAFLGVAGLIVLVFGLICLFLIENDLYSLTYIHFGVAAVLLIVFSLKGGLQFLSSSAAKKSFGSGLAVILYGVVFIGILLAANFIISKNELFKFDSTEEKVFSLAPQTKKVVSGLDQQIVVRAFYLGGVIADTGVSGVLERMTELSDKLELKLIDPEKDLIVAEKYGISENGTLHFSFADPDIKRQTKLSGNLSEQEILSAILKLKRSQEKKVYYLTGHGEPSLAEEAEGGYLFLKEAIQGENLSISKLILSGDAGVPEDASVLIVAAPKKALLPRESEAIAEFLSSGGKALVLLEPRAKSGLRPLLKPYGIIAGEDVVIEPVVELFGGPGLGVQPLARDYGTHIITAGFDEGTVFNVASSVSLVDLPETSSGAELVKTSAEGWGETDLERIFNAKTPGAKKEEGDLAGPVPLAAAVEAGETRIVAFGDSDFVNNLSIRQLYNRDLFLNSLNWLLGEENSVSIRPRSLRKSLTPITANQFTLLFVLTGVLLPEMVAILGFFIYFRRK